MVISLTSMVCSSRDGHVCPKESKLGWKQLTFKSCVATLISSSNTWRRAWHPTPVFRLETPHGLENLEKIFTSFISHKVKREVEQVLSGSFSATLISYELLPTLTSSHNLFLKWLLCSSHAVYFDFLSQDNLTKLGIFVFSANSNALILGLRIDFYAMSSKKSSLNILDKITPSTP